MNVLNSAARRLGYESLREEQAAVVHAFVEGNDVFASLETMESSKLNYERNLLESLQSNHSSSIYAYMRSITGHNSIMVLLLSVMRIRLHYLTTTFIRCSLLVILFFHQ